MGLKWFQLVDAAGVAIVDVHVASIDVPYVAVLRKVVKAEYANTRLHKTAPTDLVVYANRAVFDAKRAPLGSADSIASLGESPTDPLIVQTPPFACTRTQRRWFQLVGAAGEAVAGVDCVSVDTAIVAMLRKAVKADYADSLLVGIASLQLKVYANHADMDAKRAPLGFADSIESLDEASSDPLIVRTPPVRLPPFPPFALLANARFNARECVPLAMSSLETAKELRKECEAVPTWQADAVHSIQHLHAFMKALGGCTQHGKIYWRQEEKQIAAMLLDRWFPVSGRDTSTDKRVVLNGSSGVGKSTMFCLIAMHVAIVKKKNVLVVRQVARAFYAFFVGHDGDQVVYFSKRDCALEDAVAILRTVKENHRDFPSVCLMLDGFVHKDIPAGLKVYHLLTTSQQVHLKSDEAAITDTYLFPSWRPDDLFSLGESIYEWSDDVCKRFYYSGGSVRDFTLENADKIEILMLTVVNRVEDPLPLLFCSGVVNSGTDQVDCLRRTFVQRKQVGNPQAYLNPIYWDQAVDSAFAITELQKKKRVGDNDIASVYHWARANGSKSAALAGLLFELVFHHLAADNALRLSTTPYHKLEFRQPDAPETLQFTQLSMKEGGSIETDSTDRVLKKTLVDWKNDDKYSYWCPSTQNLETVDSIVKLEDGRVAYLQMTVSDKRTVNVASLKTLNAILGQEKPIFIVVCQTVAAAKELAFTTRADVEEASDVCDVHVGYYGEAGIDPKMDGARNNVEADSHHCRHATHHGAVMPNQQSTTRSHRTRLSPKTAKRKRSEDGDTTGESDD